MYIRFFIIAALALAFILPVAHYAKALDFKDRPAFIRRLEEKLAFYFPNTFINSDKKNQIDYGHNVGHDPVAMPEPPKVAAKIQQKKPSFSAAPAILTQDWTVEPKQSLVDAAPISTADIPPEPVPLVKEGSLSATAGETAEPLLAQEPALDITEAHNTQVHALPEASMLEVASTEQQTTQPVKEQEDSATRSLEQTTLTAKLPETPQEAQQPELVAMEPREVAREEQLSQKEIDERNLFLLKDRLEDNLAETKLVIQSPAETSSANQQAHSDSVDVQPANLADNNNADAVPSVQQQLAVQQTLEQVDSYARQQREQQAARELQELQNIQALQAQVQQQQALAETKRLQQEQQLWVKAAEDASRLLAEQQQIVEKELLRLTEIKKAEDAQAQAQALAAEHQAKEEKAQQEKAQLALAEKLAAEQQAQQALAEQQAAERQAQLSAAAEQERLAAIAARRDELKQLAQAEATATAETKQVAKALTAKQQARADQIEAERVALADKLAAEQQAAAQALAAEQQAKAEADKQQQLALEQQAKAEADKQQQLALEQQAKAEADKQQQLALAQQAKAEADKQQQLALEQQAKAEADKQQKLVLEQQAKAKADKQQQLALAQQAKAEADKQQQLAIEQQAKAEADKQQQLALEQQAKAEADKQQQLALEQQAKAEADKQQQLAIEQQAKAEADKQQKLVLEQQAKAAQAAEAEKLAAQRVQAEKVALEIQAKQLALEQQAKAAQLALEQKANEEIALKAKALQEKERQEQAQLAKAEKEAAELQAKLSAAAEQERLAAIAARRDELKQLAQAEAAAKLETEQAAKALTAKQQARADMIDAERVAMADKIAREQQAAAQALALEQQALADNLAKAEADKQQQLALEQQAKAAQAAEAEKLAAQKVQAERMALEQQAKQFALEQQAKAERIAQEQREQAELKARAQQALAEQLAAERLAQLSAKAEQERLNAIAARTEELKQVDQAEAAAKAEAVSAAKALTAKQQARADKVEAERVAMADKLAREQQAAAQALAAEQNALAAKQAKAEADKQQQLVIEQQAKAEQERLAAIAKTAEDNRQARAQVVAELSKQVDAAAQLLQSKQQARAKQVEAERAVAAERIALEQQQLAEQQAKADADANAKAEALIRLLMAEQQAKAEALAKQALAEQQARAKAEALAQLVLAEQQAKAKAEAQAVAEKALAEKKAAEAKKEEALKLAKQARDAEDLKRMAELQKQAEEIRVSLATIKQQQNLEAANAKSAAKTASEQVASENLSVGEANFIKQNKLTELVESMGTVSQGKDKAATQALPVKPPTPTAAMESGTDMNWTSMPLASDLPPQIAKLGESFIDTVYKQLPSSKKIAKSMPFDEFKLRIKEAIDTSPDIAVVSNLAEQSKSSKSLALSSLLPQVTGNSDSGKRSIKNPWLGTSYDQDGSNFGVTVSQLVFDFGAGIFGLKAGKARVKAAEELLVSKKSEQALKSIYAFIELERAREQYKLASQNAQSRLELIKLVKERFALGGGTKPDVIRAESRYAEALSSVALASSKVSAAEANYRELFASNPTGMVVGPDHEFVIEGLEKTAEQLAGTYPGLLQLARLKDATSEESKAVIAKTLPSFSLVYSGTSQGHFVSNVTPSASQSLVLQLSVPLYNGGADQARKDDARLKALQSELEFDAAMRSFEKTLLQSQAEVRSSDEIVTSRSVSVRSAIASMRAVREQFAFNKGTLLDLISVQDSLYQSGKDMIDAHADRNMARYRLAHLTSELHKVFQLSDSPLMVKD